MTSYTIWDVLNVILGHYGVLALVILFGMVTLILLVHVGLIATKLLREIGEERPTDDGPPLVLEDTPYEGIYIGDDGELIYPDEKPKRKNDEVTE